MFNWIKKKLKKVDNEEIVEVSEKIEEGIDDLSDKISDSVESATEKLDEISKTVEDKVDEVIEPKAQKIEEKVIEVKDAVQQEVKKATGNKTELKLVKESIDNKENEDEKPEEQGMFKRLFNGLNKTRKNLVYQINSVFSSNEINDDFYDELEEVLVMSDIGARTTMTIIDELRDRLVDKNIHEADKAKEVLKQVMIDVLNENVKSNDLNLMPLPSIVMLVGVNGVGKTTTVGKLAYQFKQEGMSVAIIAADTFRAAAIDQLEVWGERAGVKIISQKEGADPASVVFDGLDYSIKNNIDITIIDTAGRLHNKVNLMNELNKIKRIIDKKMPNATMEVIMALDATTGQNALLQLNEFKEAANVTGVALTKLDGTAKGGVIIPIQHEEGIPVKIIGVGESIYDLQPFDPKLFVEAIFEEN